MQPDDNIYVEESEVRRIASQILPDNEIKQITDAVRGYKIIAFTNTDDIALFGNSDKGLLLFKLADKTVNEAVRDYETGQRS